MSRQRFLCRDRLHTKKKKKDLGDLGASQHGSRAYVYKYLELDVEY